jgi:hypothetical protein
MATKGSASAGATKRAKRAESKPKDLVVAFVWDMSGSMGVCHAETVEGFNEYVMDLKAEDDELAAKHGDGIYTRMSLTVFDTVFEEWYTATAIGLIPVIGMDRYVPRGGTALFDAIARTIANTEKQIREQGGDPRVLFVINTDGQENSSVEYGLHQNGAERLRKLIKRYEKKGWTFSWLAGTLDAVRQVEAVGAHAGNVMAFASASPTSTGASYGGLSTATSTLRSAKNDSTQTLYEDAGVSNDVTDA